MSPNQRVTYLIWRARIVSVLAVVTALVAFGSIFVWLGYDNRDVKWSTVSGTVISWGPSESRFHPDRILIFVALENGQKITASGDTNGTPPQAGETISLVKREAPSGRTAYRWTR